jgi:hypothetical protein
MKKFSSFVSQLDELTGVAPKSKGEHKFVHSTYLAQIKDPGDLEKVGPEEIGPHDTKTGSGKRPADRLDNKQKFGESFSPSQIAALKAEYSKINAIDPANDTYKKLIAMLDRLDLKSLQSLAGAEIKFVSKLAQNRVMRKSMKKEEVELDEVKSAEKPKMQTSDPGYVNINGARVKDTPEDRLKHYQKTFPNAKSLPKNEEADFSKSQTTMAHTIGKYFKKKGVGDESKGGPFAVASAMVRDKPDSAKKAYATIKAKMKNEDHQDMLMALYDSLNEDNQSIFESMIETDPEKLIAFAESVLTKE